MIPHRINLALVVAAAACVSLSCLDARVRVPVIVAPVDAGGNVKPQPVFELVVRKGQTPSVDEHHRDERRVGDTSCASSYRDDTQDPTFVASQTTALDGTANFELLPGDYVLCSRKPAQNQKEWAVPFSVEGSTWVAARVETRDDGNVWVYPAEKADDETKAQLVLSNYNDTGARAGATGAQTADAQPSNTQPQTVGTPDARRGAKRP